MISVSNHMPDAQNEADLRWEQSEVYQRLGIELIALAPKQWRSAVLELTATEGGVAHTIWSDEGYRDPVDPSMELLLHVYALERFLARQRRGWKSIQFRIRMRSDESWSFGAEYEFAAQHEHRRGSRDALDLSRRSIGSRR